MSAASLHLTFDDGPDPVWTPAVLERLAASGARATFFVLGRQVRAAEGLVGAIVAGGHEVGLHGDAHLDHRTATADELAGDTAQALHTLTVHGVRPATWRLPWGRPGAPTAGLAERHGLRVVGWDADTHDWRGDRWRDQPEAVAQAGREGGIVLLHDAIGPGAPRTGCANTLEILDELLWLAGRAGLPVAPPARPRADRMAA